MEIVISSSGTTESEKKWEQWETLIFGFSAGDVSSCKSLYLQWVLEHLSLK